MITLVFLFTLAVIVGAVFAMEGTGSTDPAIRRPAGLMTWLTSGNWPAKIGGALMVVGVGSLLRYAAINIEIAPEYKLAFGVLAAALLMTAALFTGRGPAQRTLSLVLGGAAFGVAYLTAYSAFALFGYLQGPITGVGTLALVSVAAGIYAVTRNAVSLALLSMVGAYLAPAFAIGNPGPAVVYGYYVAISALVLGMVTARGWRPLIHASFLFTLAGGLFFAWTTRFYTPDHFGTMAPLLMALVALHVAMPIAEHRHVRGPWIERLDVLYLLGLPVVATVLAYVIAPSRVHLSLELFGFGAVWFAAAAWLRLQGREGTAAHAAIGLVLLALGVAARLRGLPWELIALAFAVGSLALSVRRGGSPRLHGALAGLVLLLGAVHILSSLSPIRDLQIFLNAPFLERLAGAALIIVGGRECRRAGHSLDTVLLSVGIGWAIIALGAEIVRWDLVSFALFLHWALLASAVALCFANPRRAAALAISVAVGIAATAVFATDSTTPAVAWFNLAAAPLALLALAVRSNVTDTDGSGRVCAAIVIPIVAATWAYRSGFALDARSAHFPLTVGALAAMATLLAGRVFAVRSAGWMATIVPIFGAAFAITLGVVTLFDIEREAWAVYLELACLAGLVLLARFAADRGEAIDWIAPACVLGIALVVQANLLRWLGPAGDLTVFDVAHMRSPTLVSLLWAAIGAAMTVWGRRTMSRTWWVGGATLLVASAIKLVLVDFGTLGELTNILAVIAAGAVFLLVGWLAPMPPAAPEKSAAPRPAAEGIGPSGSSTVSSAASPSAMAQATSAAPATTTASGRMGWTVALIAVAILLLARCDNPLLELLR